MRIPKKSSKVAKTTSTKVIARANKLLLISTIAQYAKKSQTEVNEFYDCLEVALHELLKKYHEVHLGINLGTLYLAERAPQPARKGLNLAALKKGKKVTVTIKAQPRSTVVRFKPAKFLKTEVKNITD
ncbi:MAG: HU family DNA-binding protein [Candidatus Phytoplasma pyri]|uniref:HU family DNA-binding protein n=1 Tax=Candidatus Phytoplasma pyri TaxID=47566 RepID=UPI003982E2A6